MLYSAVQSPLEGPAGPLGMWVTHWWYSSASYQTLTGSSVVVTATL